MIYPADPVYPHEDNFYGAHTQQSHAGYRNPQSTWGTRYAGHHEDHQNTQHYAETANPVWDDLEDDGEALLRPPPPKHMQQSQSNRLTSLSTITETSFAQQSVASPQASLAEAVTVPHQGRGVWEAYEDSPTLNPRRGWDDAPQEWRNQISPGRIRNSASAESPPPRSADHPPGSPARDNDSQVTPPSTSSRTVSQSTSPPSTPPQSKGYTGPKPFLPHSTCRPPARIPSDPSWIMTGGNAWAQGLRDKFALPKALSPGAGSWGDEYYRREQQQQVNQAPNPFSYSIPPAPAAHPRPAPAASSPKPQSHSPYSNPAHSRAYQSYSSLPRPNVYPMPPIPSHSTHPMAIWLPKGAKSVPDQIHKHDSHPSAQQRGVVPDNDYDDDDDMYVSASDGHKSDGAHNEDDVTFVDEWDRVHSISPHPQVQETVLATPYQQGPQQHHLNQQRTPPFPQQESAWNRSQTGRDVWTNNHLGHATSGSQTGRDSLGNNNYNESYTSRWQQRQASDSHPIPVWRAASGTGIPQDGPVVIAPSETTWVPPETSWDPGDDSIAPWQRRAPSNNLTHLGPLQDLRTRHRPNATVIQDPPDIPVQKSKKKWWKIFSKKR
ncbi:hypothetical protein BJ165DRAFT_1530472 [Panaeolus papilionaceus]|nr:hypothetical protein BJ165DRAFT_1530472 [Panaeolus papilionaceus]